MSVPKRRPPGPHSSNWSRSPLRQLAAAKPSQVLKPNSTTKTRRATQLTSCMTCLLLPGRDIDHRRQPGAEEDPEQLIPVEEGHTGERGPSRVEQRWPKHGA